MAFTPTSPIAPFFGFTDFTPALPEFYWDVYSAEERIKEICFKLHKIVCYINMLADNINIDHKLIDELQAAFEQFMESGFDDYYKAQITKWIDDYLADAKNFIVGHVYFGLTSDGHFCAYVPEAWDDVIFDTGMVYERSDYGHLILRYNVSGDGVIDNRYYDYSSIQNKDIAADFENAIRRIDMCYMNLFTNINENVSAGNFDGLVSTILSGDLTPEEREMLLKGNIAYETLYTNIDEVYPND